MSGESGAGAVWSARTTAMRSEPKRTISNLRGWCARYHGSIAVAQAYLPERRLLLGQLHAERSVVEPFAIGVVAGAAHLVERGGALLRRVPVAGGDRLFDGVCVALRVLRDLGGLGHALGLPECLRGRQDREVGRA